MYAHPYIYACICIRTYAHIIVKTRLYESESIALQHTSDKCSKMVRIFEAQEKLCFDVSRFMAVNLEASINKRLVFTSTASPGVGAAVESLSSFIEQIGRWLKSTHLKLNTSGPFNLS